MPTKRTKPPAPSSTASDAGRSPRRTPAKTAVAQAAPSYLDIANRAYVLFLERGGAHGFDQEDWLRAERELTPQ